MASPEVLDQLKIVNATLPFKADPNFAQAARVYAQAFHGNEAYLSVFRTTVEQRRLLYEARNISHATVAMFAGRVIGMGTLQTNLSPHTNFARIDNLAILPEYQRQGVGSVILENLEQTAQQAGSAGIILMPKVEVIPFYEKFGYMFLWEDDPNMIKQLQEVYEVRQVPNSVQTLDSTLDF